MTETWLGALDKQSYRHNPEEHTEDVVGSFESGVEPA